MKTKYLFLFFLLTTLVLSQMSCASSEVTHSSISYLSEISSKSVKITLDDNREFKVVLKDDANAKNIFLFHPGLNVYVEKRGGLGAYLQGAQGEWWLILEPGGTRPHLSVQQYSYLVKLGFEDKEIEVCYSLPSSKPENKNNSTENGGMVSYGMPGISAKLIK